MLHIQGDFLVEPTNLVPVIRRACGAFTQLAARQRQVFTGRPQQVRRALDALDCGHDIPRRAVNFYDGEQRSKHNEKQGNEQSNDEKAE